jgi:hypothetical protein
MLRLGTPERWIAAFAAAGAFGTFAVNAARFVIEKLGRQIRAARILADLTQADLARAALIAMA